MLASRALNPTHEGVSSCRKHELARPEIFMLEQLTRAGLTRARAFSNRFDARR